MAKIICPFCGNPASTGDKFCNNCGRPLPRSPDQSKSAGTRNASSSTTSARRKSVDTSSGESDHDPDAYVPDRGLWQKFFTFEGRLNPARYVLRLTVLVSVLCIIKLLAMLVCEKFQVRVPKDFFLHATLCIPLFAFPISVRRAHDMGRPGWWAIFGILPIFSAAYELCFPKVHWVDRWGEHHETTRWSDLGSIASILYLSFMLLFAVLYFMFRSGMNGENQYGPDPTGKCVSRPLEKDPLLKIISMLEEGDYSALKVTGAVMMILLAFSLALDNYNRNQMNINQSTSSAKVRHVDPDVSAVKSSVKQMIEATPPPVVNKPPQPQAVAKPLTNDNQRAAVQALINFHAGITNKNFRDAYSYLSRDFQSEVSYDGWVPGFNTTVSSSVSEVRVVSERPNAIELQYVLTAVDNINGRESTAQFNGTATLINEGGQWKLDFIKNKVR